MQRIGIRELRQNASKYIRLVREQREVIEVTDRNEVVAHLTPVPLHKRSTLEELADRGLVIPGTQDWESIKPLPPAQPGEPTLTEILMEMREDER